MRFIWTETSPLTGSLKGRVPGLEDQDYVSVYKGVGGGWVALGPGILPIKPYPTREGAQQYAEANFEIVQEFLQTEKERNTIWFEDNYF